MRGVGLFILFRVFVAEGRVRNISFANSTYDSSLLFSISSMIYDSHFLRVNIRLFHIMLICNEKVYFLPPRAGVQ